MAAEPRLQTTTDGETAVASVLGWGETEAETGLWERLRPPPWPGGLGNARIEFFGDQ